MPEEHYLSISEFSQICDVSRKTLIFYDRIGLFKPALVKENGYRYYTHRQVETITVICVLSDLGLPLREIKEYLETYEPSRARELLHRQDAVIEERVERLRAMREMLHMRLQLMEEGVSANLRCRVVEQEERPLFLSEPFHESAESDLPDRLWVKFYQDCEKRKIAFCYPPCYLIAREDLLAGSYHMVTRLGYRLAGPEKANGAMPAGQYLVSYGSFHYGDAFPLYERMRRYAKRHRLEFAGDAYEEYLLDEVATPDADAYTVKVSIPVKG